MTIMTEWQDLNLSNKFSMYKLFEWNIKTIVGFNIYLFTFEGTLFTPFRKELEGVALIKCCFHNLKKCYFLHVRTLMVLFLSSSTS